MTNPTGRVFISYRRNRKDEITSLSVALRNRGISLWRDVDSLGNEPTEDAIREALEDPNTSGAVLWISPDVINSNIIKHVEVPLAIRRYRRGNGFWLVIALVGGAEYHHLDEIFEGALGTEDLRDWNVTKIRNLSATDDDIVCLACKALRERLEAVSQLQAHDEPACVAVYAKGTFVPDLSHSLSIDWTSYFLGSSPSQDEWEEMRSSWHDATKAIKKYLPADRALMLSGTPSLPTAVLMGSGFSPRDGRIATWLQRMPDGVAFEQWTHIQANSAQIARDLGWTESVRHGNANANSLAVLINASDNTDLAVGGSRDAIPSWRAVLSINRPEGRNVRELPLSSSEVASIVHMTIDAVRNARQTIQPLTSIHFFIAGPAGLGVLLGAQLATLPPVVTYEFNTVSQKYEKAVRVIT